MGGLEPLQPQGILVHQCIRKATRVGPAGWHDASAGTMHLMGQCVRTAEPAVPEPEAKAAGINCAAAPREFGKHLGATGGGGAHGHRPMASSPCRLPALTRRVVCQRGLLQSRRLRTACRTAFRTVSRQMTGG